LQLEEQRRQQFVAHEAALEKARRRQWELVQAAEFARGQAVQLSAAFDDAQRQRQAQQRLAAQGLLLKQAQVAFKTRNFTLSVSTFEIALTLVPNQGASFPIQQGTDPWRDLAQARAGADKAAKLRAAELTATNEAALRKQREQELAVARQKLQDE